MSNWNKLTTDINVAMGLAFNANIPEYHLVNEVEGAKFNQLAKRDIAKGQDVTRDDLDRFYSVDEERLITIGKYSVKTNQYQPYNASHGVQDGATLYYTNGGALMVKESDHLIRNGDSKAYVVVHKDIFAKS